MSLLTSLLRLIPPTLRTGYCPNPPTWQQVANDIIGGTRITYLIDSGSFLYNYGPNTPAADDRIYPWLNTTYKRWYVFSGGYWISPYPISAGPNGYRILWVGLEGGGAGQLWSIDEGDGVDPIMAQGHPTPFTALSGRLTTPLMGACQSLPAVCRALAPPLR